VEKSEELRDHLDMLDGFLNTGAVPDLSEVQLWDHVIPFLQKRMRIRNSGYGQAYSLHVRKASCNE